MNKTFKIFVFGLCILGIVSTIWTLYNYTALQKIQQKVPNVEEIGTIVSLGILCAFLFHVAVMLALFRVFRISPKVHVNGLIAFGLGLISFIWLFMDWAALSDIGHEYLQGAACTMEWKVLYWGFIPHILFHGAVFVMLPGLFRSFKQPSDFQVTVRDDTLFMTMHIIGMICGGIGLGMTLLISFSPVSVHIWKYYMLVVALYCFTILFPYGIIVGYWTFRKKNRLEICDEKQRQDLTRAGITTWLCSLPGMAIMFMLNYINIQGSESVVWFPYYLFLTLSIFSGSTLYYFKRV